MVLLTFLVHHRQAQVPERRELAAGPGAVGLQVFGVWPLLSCQDASGPPGWFAHGVAPQPAHHVELGETASALATVLRSALKLASARSPL
jgi:hypothetical protein